VTPIDASRVLDALDPLCEAVANERSLRNKLSCHIVDFDRRIADD